MRVIIADSTDLVRIGIRSILTSTQVFADDTELQILDVEDKQSLVSAVSKVHTDIAIVEAAMVEDDLSSEIVNMVMRNPDTHWVLLAQKASRLVLVFVRDHSNFSLVLKNCSREEIQGCLRMAAKKQQIICNDCMKQLMNLDSETRDSILTPAECMVLALLAQGLSVKEIADMQFRSKHTIRTHKRDIFEKLKVNTTVEAIMTAFKLKIINPPE